MSSIVNQAARHSIDDLLDEGKKAAEAGFFNGALLLLWGVIEAVFEVESGEFGMRPSLLLSYAFNRNLIDESDYTFLLTALALRNRASHGTAHVSSNDTDALTGVIQRIMLNTEQHVESVAPHPILETASGDAYEYFPLGEYVVRAAGICGGRPTFKYTRIETEGALQRLFAGEAFDDIVSGYRGRVTREALQEAVDIHTRPLLEAVIGDKTLFATATR